MPIVDVERVAEVLEKAADLYRSETVDWCKGKWIEDTAPGTLSMCAEGALMKAAGMSEVHIYHYQTLGPGLYDKTNFPQAWELFHATVATLAHSIPRTPEEWDSATRVHVWNDADDRTKEEVIELFEATAKDLRNG